MRGPTRSRPTSDWIAARGDVKAYRLAPEPSFDEIAELIAEATGIHRGRITPAARLEQDLGVTGDDGIELLEALARRDGTDFDRPNHGGRYLFGPEGFDPISPMVRFVLGWPAPQIIPITVRDLHLAVVRGRWEDPPWPAT